ncbi:hypothetical protein FNH05_24355 [Amycolatopsis rhizosphaerae]|uniref:Hint domain-containing protein n=1 Tax=Amycolatopsis rhizosphaerae TaxID=2053003 RepID=A0A558BQ68_9PSEU|nr:Hint domain-containing protein [Amycolatopsis rhizosphaerae]TVT38642.1 hypothetical protein FNH05_24355 [Amycolatopsis rhizosphaerae]
MSRRQQMRLHPHNGSTNSHNPSSTSHGRCWATTTSRQKINNRQDQYHTTKIILLGPLTSGQATIGPKRPRGNGFTNFLGSVGNFLYKASGLEGIQNSCIDKFNVVGCLNGIVTTAGWVIPVYGELSAGKVAVDGAIEGANAFLEGERAESAAADAAESCSVNSFTGDTPVTLADGKEKPYNQVKLGDSVLAADPETGQTQARPVSALIQHAGPHVMVDITTSDGATLTATDHHPIWDATTHTFTYAIDLHTGDQVLTDYGSLITVTNLRIYQRNLTAYNLRIGGIHTYYAGTTPILVHNSCGPGAAFPDRPLPRDECGNPLPDVGAPRPTRNSPRPKRQLSTGARV